MRGDRNRNALVETSVEPVSVLEAPAPARSPTVGSQSVALEAWARNKFGVKHMDQAGGFIHWARKQGLKRMTSLEWSEVFAEFSNKPVGI